MTEEQRQKFERALARRLGQLQQTQLQRVLDELGDPPRMENLPPGLLDELGEELRGVVQPALEDVYRTQIEATMNSIGIGIDWNQINERAAQWAREYSFELVRGTNDTTRRALQQQIEGFFRDQRTMEDLTNSIARLFGPQRAQAIAVTEITRAASAAEAQYQQELTGLGVQYQEIWYTSRDDRVCPICGPRHNKPRGEVWTEPPPAHVNCRCVVSTRVTGVNG